jgi:chitodextrinase
VPTGLTATTVTSNSVGLSWSASTDPDGIVVGYTVYRNGLAVGSSGGATSYTDLGVYPGTTYQYTVDAVDGGGNHSSPSSPALSVTTTVSGPIGFVQGASVSTGSQATSVTLQLGQPVGAGDLLVGWFGQYNSSGQVKVSDNVNGAWTRVTTASTTFGSGGDLAFYYLQNAKPSSGLTITISATSATYLQGAASEFSGVATSGAFDQAAAASGNSTSVATGATAAVGAGELVVGGIVTGGQPGTVTPGSSQGQPFVMGTHTSAGSADLEDIVSSSAGTQNATATFTSSSDWHAGVAVFHQFSSSNAPPSVPTGLSAPTDTPSSVGLSWTASTGGATGYTIYRNGTQVGTSTTTTYTDSTVGPSTTYQYTVDAYNGAGTHSAQSSPALSVTTPATAPPSVKWIQGTSVSTGSLVTSVTLTLGTVTAGDLLVGWFGQYNSTGQVKVSDNVNGAWTRVTTASTTFGSGGDLAFYYVPNAKAATSLTITISATSATYLQGAVSEFSGVATSGAFDQAAAASGNSTSVATGATPAVGAGELVVGGIVTGGQPGTVTPGSSQGQPFVMGTHTSAGSADLEYIVSSTAGTQQSTATFTSATDWHAGVAVFK